MLVVGARAQDGLYMVKEDDKYKVYYQERGIVFEELTFSTEEAARTELVNQLLAHSGAGLFALKKRPREEQGKLGSVLSLLTRKATRRQ